MPANVPPADEDDGSIPLAGDLAIGTGRNGAVVDSQNGDGPHGRPDGDGSNDDNGLTLDSQITFPVTTAGDYYISVAAFGGCPDPDGLPRLRRRPRQHRRLRRPGPARPFAVRRSRDAPDPWGKPNVSRVIVGGRVAESGVDTIGISQSIDPGNFETSETAPVLLDYLSDPAGEDSSLNTYITPASDKVTFLGHTLSNVIAHEGGHFSGDFHTDNADDRPNVMDAGGAGFGTLFGVGPDGLGGTADDVDVDFGDDQFLPDEGFLGTEDTLGRIGLRRHELDPSPYAAAPSAGPTGRPEPRTRRRSTGGPATPPAIRAEISSPNQPPQARNSTSGRSRRNSHASTGLHS